MLEDEEGRGGEIGVAERLYLNAPTMIVLNQ